MARPAAFAPRRSGWAPRPRTAVSLGAPDYVLLLAAAAILSLGLVMILSASSVTAGVQFHDPYYFFTRQLMWTVIGLVGFLVAMRIDYHVWRRLAPIGLVVSFLLLTAVLVPGIGRSVSGSRRWLGIGSLAFQPSEVIKLSLVVYIAAWLAGKNQRDMRHFLRGTAPVLGLVVFACGLILAEPDLGTAGALLATSIVLLYVAGTPMLQFGAIFGLALPGLALAIATSAYRRQRFLAFLNPQAHPLSSGYHILQSLYALGSGGLFGVGLGHSRQKYFYLPEEHTDFIFAVLGEELGLIGGLLVLSLFAVLIWRGYRAATRAPDLFGCLLAAGITSMLAVQAVVNIGVVTALLPITGIPLPMVSFGGSSLVFTMIGLGMLTNVTRQARV